MGDWFDLRYGFLIDLFLSRLTTVILSIMNFCLFLRPNKRVERPVWWFLRIFNNFLCFVNTKLIFGTKGWWITKAKLRQYVTIHSSIAVQQPVYIYIFEREKKRVMIYLKFSVGGKQYIDSDLFQDEHVDQRYSSFVCLFR